MMNCVVYGTQNDELTGAGMDRASSGNSFSTCGSALSMAVNNIVLLTQITAAMYGLTEVVE